MGVPRQQLPRARARRRAGDGHDAARRAAATRPRAARSGVPNWSTARFAATARGATFRRTTRSCRVARNRSTSRRSTSRSTGPAAAWSRPPARSRRCCELSCEASSFRRLRTEMLRAVESDWAETDRYGLGIGEITALMGRERSPCGPAWGHIGFSVGYTAFGLSSEDGERQVVICANGSPSTVPPRKHSSTPPGSSRGTCTACELLAPRHRRCSTRLVPSPLHTNSCANL